MVYERGKMIIMYSIKYKFTFIYIFLFLGNVLIAQEDNRFSESDFKVQDRFVRAKLLQTAGKKTEAIKLLDSLRREEPTNATIHFELARMHFEKKDYNLTESNLASAIKLAPENVWFRSFEVDYLKEVGRYDDAIKSLKFLSGLQPKNADFYDKTVEFQIKKNDYNGALSTLDQKEKNIGWATSNILKKAEILDNAGKVNDAVTVLESLITRFPKDTKYLRLIVNMLHANDKVKETEPYLRKILDINPNDADAKLGLILLSKKSGSKEDFLVTLHPLISNAEVGVDIKIKELLPFVQQHATTEDSTLGVQLIELCDKLVNVHPSEAKAHAIYGDILKNAGNTIAAIRQYEKTLTLNKNIFPVWEQLMYCLDDVENNSRLYEIASEAIDYFPNQAISYYFAGKSLLTTSDIKKINAYLDDASMISAGNPNIESRVNTIKGIIAFNQKDYTKAHEWADNALAISNDKNADATELKGDLALIKNESKNALGYYKKALALGGKASRLEIKINKIKAN
jgi:tetratricopeptide (TPR) repeat protein